MLNELGLRILKSSNLIFVSAPFVFVWYRYYAERVAAPFYFWGDLAVALVFMLLYIYFARTYDAFFISHNTIGEIVISQSLAAFLADGAMYAVIVLLSRKLVNPLPLAIIAQGEQLGVKEYYDKIYLAYWNGSLPQHEVPMPCVDKIMIDAHWQYKQYPFSLRFDSSDAINYPQYDVDLKKKYTRLVS